MKESKRNIFIILCILSPLIIGYGVAPLFTPSGTSDMASGLFVILYVVLGIPVIGFTGLMWSMLTRNKTNSSLLSLYGYAVPAIVLATYVLTLFIQNS